MVNRLEKNPVQAHPGGDEEAQKQGDAHGQEGGAQLARHPLFRLEGVHPVLRQAEGKGSQPRRDGHQQGQAAGGGGMSPRFRPRKRRSRALIWSRSPAVMPETAWKASLNWPD